MTNIPTNTDMERLLAREPYLGAEHLQNQYEEIWAVMGQESFRNAKRTLRKAKLGIDIHPLFLREAKDIVEYAAHHLDRLFRAEISLNASEKTSDKEILAWCEELSRDYSSLTKLLKTD